MLAALPAAASAGTTFGVDTTSDSALGGCTPAPGDCSLRAAVLNANLGPGNTINIPAGTYTLTVPGAGEDAAATGDLDVLQPTAIAGAGAGATTINANGIDRVFDFWVVGSSVLSGVTVTGGGNVADGGGIDQEAGTLSIVDSTISGNTIAVGSSGGGGVYQVAGTLNLDRTTVSGNTVTREGGGLHVRGVATITNSTISGNRANLPTNGGGAIYNDGGTLTLTNSTLSGNATDDIGGGLEGGGLATITNTTIASNTAGVRGGGINRDSHTTQLKNSIVAGNSSPIGANCAGTVVSNGHNLENADSCAFAGPGDLKNADPLLGPLANNGGPTATHALAAGSPAIDAADPNGCPGTDQRGVARPQVAACDIGAFEFVPVPPDTTPPTASDLTLKPSSFAPARSGESVIARKPKKKKKKKKIARGTRVSYTLSEAASVALAVEKQTRGRKHGKKCKARRKKGKRCTIVKTVPGGFTVQGQQGSNEFKFTGRINRKKLKRGSYRLVATPTDAAGNRGAAVRKPFNIVR